MKSTCCKAQVVPDKESFYICSSCQKRCEVVPYDPTKKSDFDKFCKEHPVDCECKKGIQEDWRDELKLKIPHLYECNVGNVPSDFTPEQNKNCSCKEEYTDRIFPFVESLLLAKEKEVEERIIKFIDDNDGGELCPHPSEDHEAEIACKPCTAYTAYRNGLLSVKALILHE